MKPIFLVVILVLGLSGCDPFDAAAAVGSDTTVVGPGGPPDTSSTVAYDHVPRNNIVNQLGGDSRSAGVLPALLLSLFSVLLGWFFGLLSPIIAERRRANTKRRLVATGMIAELNELRMHQIVAHYTLSRRSSGVNRELLSWIGPRIADYGHLPGDLPPVTVPRSSSLSNQIFSPHAA